MNGRQVVEPKHIADDFCKYFSRIRTQVKSDIAQSSDVTVSECFIGERGFGNKMVIEPCTMLEFEKVIIITIKSISAGIDGLSLKAFKAVA